MTEHPTAFQRPPMGTGTTSADRIAPQPQLDIFISQRALTTRAAGRRGRPQLDALTRAARNVAGATQLRPIRSSPKETA